MRKKMLIGICFTCFFVACHALSVKKGRVDIYMDPGQHGWHFLELTGDTLHRSETATGDFRVEVGKDSLVIIRLNDYRNYNFSIYSRSGEPLSHKIKMPAFVYHTAGRTFFRFYNPSETQLREPANWDPNGAVMEQLRQQSVMELNELIHKESGK